VRQAWDAWQAIQRQRAHLAEVPIAQLTALLRNVNTVSGQPASPADFLLFDRPEADRQFSAEVAAVLLALEQEGRSEPLLRVVWQQVKAAADPAAQVPAIRAWRSDCGDVWLVCPVREGEAVRAGLVAVGTCNPGTVTMRDVDRPLMAYQVTIPDRPLAGWFEAGLLLRAT